MSIFSIFSIFRHNKSAANSTIDERIITFEFLIKHDIQIRHLINDKWSAWLVGMSTNYKGGEAIDRKGVGKWSAENNVAEYAWCDTREEALLAAVRYLAAKGVTMPTPQPTGCAVPPSKLRTTPPEPTPLPNTVHD